MPRRPRKQLPGGVFHITARGVDGSSIFVDDRDRGRFALLWSKRRISGAGT